MTEHKVLIAASSTNPFTTTGGLIGPLKTLIARMKEKGFDVRLVMPMVEFEDDMTMVVGQMSLGDDDGPIIHVHETEHEGAPVYLLESDELFSIYHGESTDRTEQFSTFLEAASKLPKLIDWTPDVVLPVALEPSG